MSYFHYILCRISTYVIHSSHRIHLEPLNPYCQSMSDIVKKISINSYTWTANRYVTKMNCFSSKSKWWILKWRFRQWVENFPWIHQYISFFLVIIESVLKVWIKETQFYKLRMFRFILYRIHDYCQLISIVIFFNKWFKVYMITGIIRNPELKEWETQALNHPLRLYRFFKSSGLEQTFFIQFLTCLLEVDWFLIEL